MKGLTRQQVADHLDVARGTLAYTVWGKPTTGVASAAAVLGLEAP